MNYDKLKELLSDYDHVNVDGYIAHIYKLSKEIKNNAPKNAWVANVTEKQAAEIFEKVAKDNIYIDGVDINLQYMGGLTVSYNYQAYKNRVLNVYPESKFDMQLVHEGDEFDFRKESGRVIYHHKVANPFNNNRIVIGAYCIIKNSKGEFLETLNKDELDKMQKASKMGFIWQDWYGEMCLKSAIKRACKRHFKDITSNIDTIDNEQYDLDKLSDIALPDELVDAIKGADTLDKLKQVYDKYKDKVKDKNLFLGELKIRKEQVIELANDNTQS